MMSTTPLPCVAFDDGRSVPALGLGTWRMGEDPRTAPGEVAALELGLSLGMTLIDTAEMYGEGGAEKVVGRAIAGRRDRVFLVSKVYPHNATAKGTRAACHRSLKRLGVDHLDLYLLHWRGRVPLAETVAAFEALHAAGDIRRWGVSNFDVDDMEELLALPEGRRCAANQVLYHLGERAAEWRLLALCRTNGIVVMAYSPLGQGDLLADPRLAAIAAAAGTTPARLALAWSIVRPGMVAIPKASRGGHVRENRTAADLVLDAGTIAALDAAFPPPKRARRIPIL